MKTLVSLSLVATALSAGSVAAQATQQGVLGPSENAEFPVRVEASDGVIYNCKQEITQRDGQPVRACVPEGADGGTVFGQSGDLGVGAGAAVAGLVLVAAAIGSGGDGVSTTTTTGN
jgi:hypothetical protein